MRPGMTPNTSWPGLYRPDRSFEALHVSKSRSPAQGSWRRAGEWLCIGQSLSLRRAQILDQVVVIRDADGQAHKPVVDAKFSPHLRRHGGMGHDGRMLDEAFHTPEALRQREELAALQEARRAVEPTLDAGGDDAAEAAHLALGE